MKGESISHIKIKHGDYVHDLKKSKKLFVFADKTSKIYQIETYKYKKLTTDAIMPTNNKILDKIRNKFNADGKKILENKEVVNRLLANGKNSCFIILKDQKPHFLTIPKFAD